jgi:hypothetical protein
MKAFNRHSCKIQISYAYADGGGGIIMNKHRQSPVLLTGKRWNSYVVDTTPTRWIGNGRTILNNRTNSWANSLYFSTTFEFEDAKHQSRRTPIITYDTIKSNKN